MPRPAAEPQLGFEARREVLGVVRDSRVLGTAEFIERVLLIDLEPWQMRICDFIDTPKQG